MSAAADPTGVAVEPERRSPPESSAPPACGPLAHQVNRSRRDSASPLDTRFSVRVDYQVRQARITDIDRFYAICVEMGAAPETGSPLEALGLLRQLVYLPNASVVVAESGRQVIGGAVLGLRPSVRVGGFVGTIDVLVVTQGQDTDKVADALIVEIMNSARRKGCTSVEVTLMEDSALRASWIRHGFARSSATTYTAGVSVREPAPR